MLLNRQDKIYGDTAKAQTTASPFVRADWLDGSGNDGLNRRCHFMIQGIGFILATSVADVSIFWSCWRKGEQSG